MGFFYNLGRLAGRKLTEAKWMMNALAGSEEDRIAAEFAYGKMVAETHIEGIELDDSGEGESVVRELGERLAGRLTNKGRVFHFYCEPGETPNAFALPGGFIFVARPLLDACGSDRDEVGFVLAHEIAHVVKGHSSERFVTSMLMNLISRHGVAGGPVRSAVKNLLQTVVRRGYSQGQEFEADEFAWRLAKSAGLDASAGVRTFERLKAALGQTEGLGEYFSTHPTFDERIARLRAMRE